MLTWFPGWALPVLAIYLLMGCNALGDVHLPRPLVRLLRALEPPRKFVWIAGFFLMLFIICFWLPVLLWTRVEWYWWPDPVEPESQEATP